MDYMIDFNKIKRPIFSSSYEHLGPSAYAREHQTIHCNMGRRTGKTSYILEHATSSDLIVVHSESRRRDINSEIRARVQVIRSEELITMQRQVICCEACKRPYENVRVYDNIWVDEPELCFREVNLTRLYNVLAYNPEQTFILLGE